MDVEQLIGSVIQGALGGKRKKSRGVTRFLTGGKSSFLNASTLLALGGLAWGVYETMTQSAGTPAAPPGSTPVAAAPRGERPGRAAAAASRWRCRGASASARSGRAAGGQPGGPAGRFA